MSDGKFILSIRQDPDSPGAGSYVAEQVFEAQDLGFPPEVIVNLLMWMTAATYDATARAYWLSQKQA